MSSTQPIYLIGLEFFDFFGLRSQLSSIIEAEICAIVFTVFLVIAMVWSIVPNARKPHMQTVLSLIHFMKLIHSCKISNALMGIDVRYTCPLLI